MLARDVAVVHYDLRASTPRGRRQNERTERRRLSRRYCVRSARPGQPDAPDPSRLSAHRPGWRHPRPDEQIGESASTRYDSTRIGHNASRDEAPHRELHALGDVEHRQIRLPHVALRPRLDPPMDAREQTLSRVVVERPMA
jgi:hypothetical protein